MGRKRSKYIDILYARVKPANKAKLLRFVENMKKAGKKHATVSAQVDRLIEKSIYA